MWLFFVQSNEHEPEPKWMWPEHMDTDSFTPFMSSLPPPTVLKHKSVNKSCGFSTVLQC